MGEWWVKVKMRKSKLVTERIKAIYNDVKEKEKIIHQMNKLEAKRRSVLVCSFGKTTQETLIQVGQIEDEMEKLAEKLGDLSVFFNKLSDKEFKIFQMYFQDGKTISEIRKECKISYNYFLDTLNKFGQIYPL